MQYRNEIISASACLLTILSAFFLLRMVLTQQQYLMPSSKPRLMMFLAAHAFIVAMMIWFILLNDFMDYVKWGFAMTLTIALAFTILQVYLYVEKYRNANSLYNIKTVLPMELAYLNCYFLVYMYTLICSFLTGLFLLLTKICICIHQRRIKVAIKQSIIPIDYTEQLSQKQCAICINHLQNNDYLLKMKCGHIFHEDCLLEWIKVNQTCPTCRFNVFSALEGQNIDIQIIRQ